MERDGTRALVIGGGIVGACCGYALARRGFDVTIIEKDEPGRAASFGNSGSIGLASVPPLGMPGMMKDAPRMLLDPNHALVVRWRTLGLSVPWLRRFAKTMAPDRVEGIAAARAALLSHAGDAYDDLLAEIGHPELIERTGLIFAYESERSFAGARSGIELRRRHGIAAQELTGPQMREMEPAISERAVRGVLYPAVRTVTESLALTTAIMDAFRALGGIVLKDTVTGFQRGPAGVDAVITATGPKPCDVVVLAAGAWSRELARTLGDPVALIAERGYHVMLPHAPHKPKIPLVSADHNVSIVTMTTGLRLTTLAEFTAVDAPPDHDRAMSVFKRAAGLIRGLTMDVESRWMGSRPSTPDSLPVIGRSPNARNVIYAFGHGHLGLTFGAVTARLVAQLAREETPNMDIAAYRPDRAFDGAHVLQ